MIIVFLAVKDMRPYKGNLISKKFTLSKNKNKILFTSFEVEHGKTTSTAIYL
jgi:hypothetical protein